jgi:Fe-S-cluster containining protein
MIDTFYLHIEFANKNSEWSINLPFLCNKCGVCCKLEDFLTAGETKADSEVDAKVKALFQELGKMWEADPAKYHNYVAKTSCPFLVNNTCSIYEIRPDGCRLFPKTTFGMLTENCEPLTRFKEQRSGLKKGRTAKETYHFSISVKSDEPTKPTNFTKKQYHACIAKLRQAGITDDELALFRYFNRKSENQQVQEPTENFRHRNSMQK